MVFRSHRPGEIDGTSCDVRVNVHTAGKDNHPCCVDCSPILCRRGEMAAVVDEKVFDHTINAIGRVVDFSTCDPQHRLHLFRDHLGLAAIRQPERLPGDRFVDPANDFLIRGIG